MKVLVNIFGAPGAGKSTTATGVFSRLKLAGVNAEYVPEVAKDFTWEERKKSLTFQPYVHAKQMRNIERLMDKVDVVVTDSPPMLSSFYAKYYQLPYRDSFHKWVRECHELYLQPALNYYLVRTKPYNPAGRNQTEDEARLVAAAQAEWLNGFNMKFRPTLLEGDQVAIDRITNWVMAYLRGKRIVTLRQPVGIGEIIPQY